MWLCAAARAVLLVTSPPPPNTHHGFCPPAQPKIETQSPAPDPPSGFHRVEQSFSVKTLIVNRIGSGVHHSPNRKHCFILNCQQETVRPGRDTSGPTNQRKSSKCTLGFELRLQPIALNKPNPRTPKYKCPALTPKNPATPPIENSEISILTTSSFSKARC